MKLATPPASGCAAANCASVVSTASALSSRPTSFTSPATDGGQQSYLVAITRLKRCLVGQHRAIERDLHLLARQHIAKRAIGRGNQPRPIKRRGHVSLLRACQVGQLAEE